MVEDSLGAAETQRRKTLLELCQSSAESSVDVRVLPLSAGAGLTGALTQFNCCLSASPALIIPGTSLTTPPTSERLGQNNTQGKTLRVSRPTAQSTRL
ncbi:hypothetical protein AOLI_G00083210 [Acnodon oligacanthus]